MAQLHLSDLRKSFGRTEVIKGLTLAIADGEFVVFVGPSGCGKSTTCLLYTSPSPRDRTRSRMPSSA